MKLVYRFFVVLGVIFFALLIGVGYFIITDPFNLRPVVMSMYSQKTEITTSATPTGSNTTDSVRAEPESYTALSSSQAQALKTAGIDPQSVPTQFTAEQIVCFVNILGQERVDAIAAGDTPTPAEFYQAIECL